MASLALCYVDCKIKFKKWAQFHQSIEDNKREKPRRRNCRQLQTSYRRLVVCVRDVGLLLHRHQKFFVPFGQVEIKPTRRGLALRLREWSQMKKIMRWSTMLIPFSVPLYPVISVMTTKTKRERYSVANVTRSRRTSFERCWQCTSLLRIITITVSYTHLTLPTNREV